MTATKAIERRAATAARQAAVWGGRLAAAREAGLQQEASVLIHYFRTLATQALPVAPQEAAAVITRCYLALRPELESAITDLKAITERTRRG